MNKWLISWKLLSSTSNLNLRVKLWDIHWGRVLWHCPYTVYTINAWAFQRASIIGVWHMAFYMFITMASVAIDSTYLTPPGCSLHIGVVVEKQRRWKRLSSQSQDLGKTVNIRQVCRKYHMKVIFTSGLSLRSVLTKVKDPLPVKIRSKVVYKITCSWSGAWLEGPTHHQMEGDHNGWHGQIPQWAVTQGSHPHPHDPY